MALLDVDISEIFLSLRFDLIALQVKQCVSESLFLNKHSEHSHILDCEFRVLIILSFIFGLTVFILLIVVSLSESNCIFDSFDFSDLEQRTSITLPDFNSSEEIVPSLFFIFSFSLGAIDESDQIKFCITGGIYSLEDILDLIAFLFKDEFISLDLSIDCLSALIGLLKVKLLIDFKFFVVLVTFIGLANVNVSCLSILVSSTTVVLVDGIKLKLGKEDIGKGIFGKLTGSIVSSCSSFVPLVFP